MVRVRRAHERGHARYAWLDTYHTFSFGEYRDPAHTRFRALRVMNEDWIAPGGGFGMHPHDNMEIVTYVMSGALEHHDSMGNGAILRAGELQRMTAGTGLLHSESNASSSEPVHLYQVWLFPERTGLVPGYEQTAFAASERVDRWQTVASRNGAEGSLTIHQDVRLSLARLTPGNSLRYSIAPGRHAWLQVLAGQIEVNGEGLSVSDGAAVTGEPQIVIDAITESEVWLFDLA